MSAPTLERVPKRPSIVRRPTYPMWQLVVQLLAGMAVLAVIWEMVARFGDISSLYLPAFTDVVGEFSTMVAEGVLLEAAGISLMIYVIGLALSVALAVPLGLALGAVPLLNRAVSPYIWALYTTPSVIIMPLILLWVGINDAARVLLVVIEALPAITVVVIAGVRTVDSQLMEMAKSFSAGKLDQFTKIIFPASLPYIGTGIRMGVTRGLIGLFVGELFTATHGIGYLLSLAQTNFNSARTFAILLLFILFSVGLVYLSRLVQQRLSARGA